MTEPSPPPFEVIDHTADVGLVVRGASLEDVFVNAATGMFSLMVEVSGVRDTEERRVELEGHDWEDLLVRWLSELLYYLDAEEMLFRRFEVKSLSPHRLAASAWGERIDRDRHELHFGVKAVTRHMLEVRREDSAWRAQVLFDI
ncbi:MAG: archease [Chloroflexi bacterium]|nr:archease [Chloroflexota bacterium]